MVQHCCHPLWVKLVDDPVDALTMRTLLVLGEMEQLRSASGGAEDTALTKKDEFDDEEDVAVLV